MWTDGQRDQSLLLMLDFDGTLVPIAPTPDAIQVSPRVPAVLGALKAVGHEVWIVSGRHPDDIRQHLGPSYRGPIVGLHGLAWPGERLPGRSPQLDEAARRVEGLRAADPRLAGVRVEDKRISLAFHYRQVEEALWEHARQTIADGVQALLDPSLNLLFGHAVVELRPKEASKAHAVRTLVGRFRDRIPFYIGDDATDEEAFAALPKEGIGVRVGKAYVETRAAIRVPDVETVLSGLESLAQQKKAAGGTIARSTPGPAAKG